MSEVDKEALLLPQTTVVLTYTSSDADGGAASTALLTADSAPVSSSTDTDTAIQKGERPYWCSREWFGVYYQYVAVGVFLGSANPLMYPVFVKLIGMESYRVKGAYSVMTLWWSLKVFIGALSDCVPLFGFKRKSYMVLGWGLATALATATIFFGQPYKDAPAWWWLLCFSGINMGYIVGDVACDAFVTDLAQREPIAERGKLQSTIYFVRFIAMSATALLISFGFSSAEYGGTFSWGFKLPQYVAIMVRACI